MLLTLVTTVTVLLVKLSGRSNDWQLTDNVQPLQSEVIWMSDSAADYAKYATVI